MGKQTTKYMGLLPELTRFQTPGLEPSSVQRDYLTKSAVCLHRSGIVIFPSGLLPRLTDRLHAMKHAVLATLSARSVQQ